MLSRCDPRAKLAVVSAFSTLAVLCGGILPLGVLFFTTAVAVFLFGCNLSALMRSVRGFLSLVVFMALIQSIFTRSGAPLLLIGGFPLITTGGAQAALSFLLRMLIITSSAAILSTSSGRELIQGLIQLKIPYEVAFMAMIGIKFIPALREQFRDVLTAMQLRGIDFKEASLREKLALISCMFTPVVAGAIMNSRQVAISVTLRGFRAFPTRTSHYTLTFSKKDWGVVVLTAIFTLLFIAWIHY